MAKLTVAYISDSESTGSNSENFVSAPSMGNQLSTPTKVPNKQTSNKSPEQSPTQPSLSINPYETVARAVPSPSLPKANQTAATAIRSLPPPKSNKTTTAPQPAALRINGKAAGNGAGQHQRFHPYAIQKDQQRKKTMDLLSLMEACRLAAAAAPPPNTQMDQQPQRTMDFLSQMEAGGSAPMQVSRENPPTEMLAEWAAFLELGNGTRKDVDLNLKLKLV